MFIGIKPMPYKRAAPQKQTCAGCGRPQPYPKMSNPKEYRDWRAHVQQILALHYRGREPHTGPVGVEMEIGIGGIEMQVYPIAESIRPSGLTGDGDNYAKAVIETTQGIVIADDRQVQIIEAAFRP